MDKSDCFASRSDQMLPIPPPERRAGADNSAMEISFRHQPVRNRLQPRPTIRICQRLTCTHFRNIFGGMKIVAINEPSAKLIREQPSNRGFAAP